MDWNTLGTWAAVVVALGLALRESLTRFSERRATHLLTSARILPSCGRMDTMLQETLEESEIIDPETASASLLLDACGVYAARLDANGLGRFKGIADQHGALPPGMLIPVVKVLMLEEMMLEDHIARGDQESSQEEARNEFEHWRNQMRAMRTSLRWIIRGAEKQMNTWRWRHPEVGAWPQTE